MHNCTLYTQYSSTVHTHNTSSYHFLSKITGGFFFFLTAFLKVWFTQQATLGSFRTLVAVVWLLSPDVCVASVPLWLPWCTSSGTPRLPPLPPGVCRPPQPPLKQRKCSNFFPCGGKGFPSLYTVQDFKKHSVVQKRLKDFVLVLFSVTYDGYECPVRGARRPAESLVEIQSRLLSTLKYDTISYQGCK